MQHAAGTLDDHALHALLGGAMESVRNLGEEARSPHATLPVREDSAGQCARYHASRLEGRPYAEPEPGLTVAAQRARQ